MLVSFTHSTPVDHLIIMNTVFQDYTVDKFLIRHMNLWKKNIIFKGQCNNIVQLYQFSRYLSLSTQMIQCKLLSENLNTARTSVVMD